MEIFGDIIEQQVRKLVKTETLRANNLVHLASKSCIFTTTDKLLREVSIGSESYDKKKPSDVQVPIQETWDLHMGDNVRFRSEFIKYETLKNVSKQTVGWNKNVAKAKFCVGVITSICNEYDCHVQVLFPDCSLLLELYAGILEKTKDNPTKVTVSRFKKGDKVFTDASPEFVALQQKNYGDFPSSMVNKIGEVIAVTSEGVFVAFTSTFSLKVNPATLKIGEGPIERFDFTNSKELLPGIKVRITGNLKKFMKEMMQIGEWERWLSKYPGEFVTVLLVKENDILRVCARSGRSFNVQTSSVLLNDKVEDIEEDVPFKVNDWVKVKKSPHINNIFKSKNVPVSLLEYLDYPARVINYTSETECGISYDSKYTISVPLRVLEKASIEEATLAQDIFSRSQKLDIGDEVYLRLGPPNFVRDIVKEIGFGEEVLEVFTNVATLRGYIGFDKAVIECSDGKLRKINKNLLTLPEKYSIKEKGDLSHDLEHVPGIIEVVKNSIVDIQKRFIGGQTQLRLAPPLQCVNLSLGQPSTLQVDIKTLYFGYRDLEQELQKNLTWKFTGQKDDERIKISEIDSRPVDIFVRFVFNAAQPSLHPMSNKLGSDIMAQRKGPEVKPEKGPVKPTDEVLHPDGDKEVSDSIKSMSKGESSELPLKADRQLQHPVGDILDVGEPIREHPQPPMELAGYDHIECKVGNKIIFVPYRIRRGRVEEERSPARDQTARIIQDIVIDSDSPNM